MNLQAIQALTAVSQHVGRCWDPRSQSDMLFWDPPRPTRTSI